MNLYILTYELWKTWNTADTSDGFPSAMQDWKKREREFEAESDDDAREHARKLLTEVAQSGQKIQRPILTCVVILPKVDGVKTYKDLQPYLKYAHYFQKD